MNKKEMEKLLLGKCLNGFTITRVEYDPFIKEQINLITDGVKIVPPCNDRDIVIFRLRDKNTFGASWYEELVSKEHKALLDIEKLLLSEEQPIQPSNIRYDILEIIKKALGDKE